MATLDWSQCPALESVPGRLSGAWVFRDTRMPLSDHRRFLAVLFLRSGSVSFRSSESSQRRPRDGI